MPNFINKPNTQGSSGFTLIEVLITILVVSIGLLGLAGLQISGLRANMGSEARSIATILANDMAERMHANPLGVDANDYDNISSAAISAVDDDGVPGCNTPPTRFCSYNSGGVTPVTAANGCTPAEMAAFDAWVWTCGLPVATGVQRGGIVNKLLNGSAGVTCNDDPCGLGSAHTITVNWSALNPERSIDENNTDTLARTYTLVVVP